MKISSLFVAAFAAIPTSVYFGSAQPQAITSSTAAGLTSLLNDWFIPGGAGNSYIKSFCGVLQARLAYGITSSWFEALAPYQTNTIGLRATIPKVVLGNSDENKQISALYATRVVLNSLIVQSGFSSDLDTFLTLKLSALGVTANFAADALNVNTSTPIGIGNVAGAGVVTHLLNDGSNQLGSLGGHKYFKQRYQDYTGYVPLNPGGTLKDIRFWQPVLADDSIGVFNYQAHILPQLSVVPGVSIDNSLDNILSPGSTARTSTLAQFETNLKPLIDDIIATQAGLTDEQKVLAELFNDMPRSYLPAIAYLINVPLNGNPLTIDEFVAAAFTGAVAAWDAALIGFQNKVYWNSVRPLTVIRNLYKDSTITTWVTGQGAVAGVPGADFKNYLGTPAETSYPSTVALYFSAFAHAEKKFFNSDTFGFSYTYPAGSSAVEPLLTPAVSTTITADTFTSIGTLSGQSRYYGGVHFQEDIDESYRITAITGPLSYQFVQSLLSGTSSDPISPTELVTTPTVLPVDDPTLTKAPTSAPTFKRSRAPTKGPVRAPTKYPSIVPTKKPNGKSKPSKRK
jgi:hypothetical protein